MATLFTAEEVIEAFLAAQHADFSPKQIKQMIAQADATGASKDYGDGYSIIRVGDTYSAQVHGKWL